MSSDYVLGLDLGGSSIKWLAATNTGKVLASGNVPFDPSRPLHWAEQIKKIVAEVQLPSGNLCKSVKYVDTPSPVPSPSLPPRLLGIGLSAPGLAARDARSIAHMPGRLQGLENLNWQTCLNTPFPIPVLNDAHAALLGEAWIGAAAGRSNVIMLTLGTGVGGAAMVDGHLLLGHIGRAGHLGHISLDPFGPSDVANTPGSLELAIGNCSINHRSLHQFATTHDLIAAVEASQPEATAIWHDSVRKLAAAIASFINILDPEIIIIGGGIARAGQTLFDPLEKFLRPMEWQPGGHRVPIAPAKLGEHAGAFGAARRAWQSIAAGDKHAIFPPTQTPERY